jgi:WD40 repeat protein/tRNA A-37 threonylcarbamoyl transferase component Bud32
MQTRCPHCRNPIEMLDDLDSGEVNCPSCGSRFSLLGSDETITSRSHGGQTLGHFTLDQRLGVGAFGAVWRAKDRELDRVVAIKIPRRDQLDAIGAEQLLREARSAAQLKHPNIVQVYEIGREGDTVYIVSELIDGLTLSDWLTGYQPGPREAVALCIKIAAALHHAHERGVIHRDLKPSNVMLDRENEPHLLDFGLAKRQAGEITITMDGQVLGTPAYMSPEQARGESHRVDRRADVYSLGVILFELLTGERPFRGNKQMLLHQVLTEDAPSPRKFNATVPRDLETICLHCLEKDPQRRYVTAEALQHDLQRFLEGKPIAARPIGVVARGWRWCQRNAVVSALLASILVVFAAGFGLSLGQWLRAEAALQASDEARWGLLDANEKLTKAADQERRNSYAASMRLVQSAWEAHNLEAVRSTLERWRPSPGEVDLRGFEWHYWDSIAVPPTLTLQGHSDLAFSVAFSPDDTRLVTGGFDGKAIVWDLLSRGEKSTTLIGHTDRVRDVAFNGDGTEIITGSSDGTARIWNVSTGEARLVLRDDESAKADSATAEPAAITRVAFSRDGRLVATKAARSASVWDAMSGERKFALPAPAMGGEKKSALSASIYDVAFDPEGRRLVSGEFRRARVWDLESGDVTASIDAEAAIAPVAFSRDGAFILSPRGQWDARTGEERAGAVRQVEFRGNDHRFLAWDAGGNRVLADRSITNILPPPKPQIGIPAPEVTALQVKYQYVQSGAFSADGQRVAMAGSKVQVWEIPFLESERQLLHEFPVAPVGDFALSADGNYLIAGHGRNTFSVWDVAAHQERWRVQLPSDVPLGASISVRPDGREVACVPQRTHKAYVLDVATGEQRFEMAHRGSIHDIAYCSQGKKIATASNDRTVRLWDAFTGEELQVLRGHSDGVASLAFNPTATRLVTGAMDGSVRVFDLPSGDVALTLSGHEGWVNSVAYHPSGAVIATAASDGTARLWDSLTGELLGTLEHTSQVRGLTFSPDGSRLVTWENNHFVMWDVESRQETWRVAQYVKCLAFSPDGVRVLVGSTKSIEAFDIRSAEKARPAYLELYHQLLGAEAEHGRREWRSALESYEVVLEGAWKLLRSEEPLEKLEKRLDSVHYERLFRRAAEGVHRCYRALGDDAPVSYAVARERYRQMLGEDADFFDSSVEMALAADIVQAGGRVTVSFNERVVDYAAVASQPLFGARIQEVDWSNDPPADPALLHRLQNCDRLESLTLWQPRQLADGDVARFPQAGLKRLTLQDAPDLTDESLRSIGQMDQLEVLRLWGAGISGSGLEHLSRLSNLTSLRLGATPLESVHLGSLRSLSQLEQLSLYGTKVDDAGLSVVSDLPGLKWLSLGRTKVGDEGVRHLAGLQKLAWLELGETEITDAAMEHVVALSALRELQLYRTAVTDAAVEQLVDGPPLTRLLLFETKVSDEAIPALSRLSSLKFVDLSRTEVTAAGVERLRLELPDVVVKWGE